MGNAIFPIGMHLVTLVLLVTGGGATAQAPDTVLLRGTVTGAESNQALPFSIVSLHNARKQFTDAAGTFSFAVAKFGRYVLSVRQIGYAPLDTQIVIGGDSATTIRVALRRLAIELPPVTVSARQCTTPGRPDSSDAALLTVFEQLQENARRFELLADSYPFHFTLELVTREVNQRGDTGKAEIKKIHLPSDDHHPYTVGRVVERAWGPWGSPDSFVVIHSAEPKDLGNAAFIASHCFYLVGRDTIGGDEFVRLDFEPATRIGSADMAGSAYLDPTTYELRHTVTTLTRPDRSELANVRAMTFRTRFRNIAPGVPLQDSLVAVTDYRYGTRAKIEIQRTVDVRFTKHGGDPLRGRP